MERNKDKIMNQVNGSTATTTRLGEVIEGSTIEYRTHCYDLYAAPPLGSLVRCGDGNAVYGIVCDVSTQSIDPSRHAIPRGRDSQDEEDVYLNNPQLMRLLYTQFQAVIVGFKDDESTRRYLPPFPPRIHSFVYDCDDAEIRAFSESLDFLPVLLSAPINAQDDVIASFLRIAGSCHEDSNDFLVNAGKTLATLMAGQLPRLNNVLRRISP